MLSLKAKDIYNEKFTLAMKGKVHNYGCRKSDSCPRNCDCKVSRDLDLHTALVWNLAIGMDEIHHAWSEERRRKIINDLSDQVLHFKTVLRMHIYRNEKYQRAYDILDSADIWIAMQRRGFGSAESFEKEIYRMRKLPKIKQRLSRKKKNPRFQRGIDEIFNEV